MAERPGRITDVPRPRRERMLVVAATLVFAAQMWAQILWTPAGEGMDVFGHLAYIEFIAEPELTLASPVDAYVLEVRPNRALDAGNLLAGAGSGAVTLAEDTHAADLCYSYSAPNGDPWYEATLLAWGSPASLSRSFDLPDLAAGDVTLELVLWGYGDWPGIGPDHHVIVEVNGTQVLDRRFDGFTPLDATIDLTGLVNESGNVLEIRVPGDTGFQFDYAAYDGLTVRYPRATD